MVVHELTEINDVDGTAYGLTVLMKVVTICGLRKRQGLVLSCACFIVKCQVCQAAPSGTLGNEITLYIANKRHSPRGFRGTRAHLAASSGSNH